MLKKWLFTLSGVLLASAGINAQALITLDPSSPSLVTTSNDNSALSESEVAALVPDSTVNLLYKANVGGPEEGSFAASYETTFSNTALDPEDALVEWISATPTIDCTDNCYALVKDGNQTPAQYLFDISTWDGMEDLLFENFWPDQGAISFVGIYGGDGTNGGPPTGVPAPGSLGTLGGALILLGGMALWRRRDLTAS